MSQMFFGPQHGSMSSVLAASNRPDQETANDAAPEPEVLNFDSWIGQYTQNCKNLQHEASTQVKEDLRVIFEKENQILEDLFKPVNKCIQAALVDDAHGEGKKLYRLWGQYKHKQYNHSCFDNPLFRAEYASHRFRNAAQCLMQSLALRIIPQHPKVEEYLQKIHQVVSVGVGPCCDVAGMLAFLRARGFHQPLTYFLIDQCRDWAAYVEECDSAWRRDYHVSMWLKFLTMGRSEESLTALPDADVIVFSFADTAIMNKKIWPILQRKYRLVIVLDGIKVILKDIFTECNFTICNLNDRMNLYYAYRDDDDNDNEQLPVSPSVSSEHTLSDNI